MPRTGVSTERWVLWGLSLLLLGGLLVFLGDWRPMTGGSALYLSRSMGFMTGKERGGRRPAPLAANGPVDALEVTLADPPFLRPMR
jgi:hypothetical protein